MEQMIPLFGPVPGGMEMMVILLIAVLLFGANKIPKLARSTGEAMGEFKKGRQEIEEELEEATDPNADFSSETDANTGTSANTGGNADAGTNADANTSTDASTNTDTSNS